MVVEEQDDGSETRVPRHEMVRLLEKPNPYYSGVLMWMATVVDLETGGDGYWLKMRSRNERVQELWWAPSWTMTPKWPEDGSAFISHYEYRPDPGKDAEDVQPEDVVHFRYGIDPKNSRRGVSQLKSLMRELFTDEECANFSASLVRNLGVPGVVISPDGFKSRNKEGAEQIKDEFMQKFGGDRRGEPMVMTAPSKVQVLAFSPDQMKLTELRRIPEERAAAVFGISPMVIGFGSGLANSSFTNYENALAAAWNQNIIPKQRLIAADLEIQLLPDFDRAPNRDVSFDHTRVRALQADIKAMFERIGQAVREGWCRVDTAQQIVGLPVDTSQNVYLRPLNIVPIKPDDTSVPLVQVNASRASARTEGRNSTTPARNGTEPEEEEATVNG